MLSSHKAKQRGFDGDRETESKRQTYRQTGRHAGRQASKQADRQIDRLRQREDWCTRLESDFEYMPSTEKKVSVGLFSQYVSPDGGVGP